MTVRALGPRGKFAIPGLERNRADEQPPAHPGFAQECEAGHTLPQAFYGDPELYSFDTSAVLTRSWFMLGFEAELAAPGAYLAVTLGPHPVLVVRGRDGIIRGFHNTCRHRGAQICAEGSRTRDRMSLPPLDLRPGWPANGSRA